MRTRILLVCEFGGVVFSPNSLRLNNSFSKRWKQSFLVDRAPVCRQPHPIETVSACLPPWPNGQGVGLLIRRLRARVPQGVLSLQRKIKDYRSSAVEDMRSRTLASLRTKLAEVPIGWWRGRRVTIATTHIRFIAMWRVVRARVRIQSRSSTVRVCACLCTVR